MQPVHARAPVRIDLAGGTLDIWPLNLAMGRPAITLGVALDLPVEARVEATPDGAIVLHSDDLGETVRYPDRAALGAAVAGGACPLDLLGRAVLAAGPREGLTLSTRARLPTGSGLGTSSALLAAALGALEAAAGRPAEPRALQRLAQDVETALLGTPTGYQDYFPPLLGGCVALVRRIGGLDVEPVPVDLAALAGRLRLVYTGEPHVSGITNWGVVRAFLEGEAVTVGALRAIAGHAAAAWDALRRGDLDGAFEAMLADGRARRAMAPGVSTTTIEALDEAVRAAGALGTKICGAGGGGCVLVLLPAGGAPGVDEALEAGPWTPLPVRLTAQGLTVEALPA